MTRYLTGIDTNVLLRYLLRDDAGQFDRAAHLLEGLTPESPGLVTHMTLAEIYWVLARARGLDRATVLAVVGRLVRTDALEFEDGETVVRALQLAARGADFPDALIQGSMEQFGAAETVTFDRSAAERLGWRLL